MNVRDGSFTNLDLRVLDEPGQFLTLNSFAFESPLLSYIVPAGFRTDLASIPAMLRPFFSRTGSNRKPAVAHDHMYSCQYQTREICDLLFRDMLIVQGLSPWKASLYFLGVRSFGWTRGSW